MGSSNSRPDEIWFSQDAGVSELGGKWVDLRSVLEIESRACWWTPSICEVSEGRESIMTLRLLPDQLCR